MGLYFSHNIASKWNHDFIEKSWGITAEQALLVKQRMLKTYYGISSDIQLQEYEKIIESSLFTRRLLMPVTPAFNYGDDKARNFINKYVSEFLKVVDEIPDMIKTLPI